jgi:hypothetical protein
MIFATAGGGTAAGFGAAAGFAFFGSVMVFEGFGEGGSGTGVRVLDAGSALALRVATTAADDFGRFGFSAGRFAGFFAFAIPVACCLTTHVHRVAADSSGATTLATGKCDSCRGFEVR